MKIEIEKEVTIVKTFNLELKEVSVDEAPVDYRLNEIISDKDIVFRLYDGKIYGLCCYFASCNPVQINCQDILGTINYNRYHVYLENDIRNNISEKKMTDIFNEFQKNVIVVNGELYHVTNFSDK